MTLNHLDLGGVRLYWLDGGGFRLDGGSLFGPVPRPRWSALYPPADDNSVPLTAHTVLVETGSTWGLLDSGFGHHLTDRQRRAYTLERDTQLEQGLAEVGISAASIDWIVLSHLHLDHAGGVLTKDGDPAFPHAQIWVQELEAHEARDETNRAHGMYTGNAFDRLEGLGLVHEVDGDTQVVPGVRVFLTGGHSRGHQVTRVESSAGATASSVSAAASSRGPEASSGGATAASGRAALLYLGDLLVTHAHVAPAWVSALDDFPLDTIRAKRRFLGEAAQNGWWVAFSHDVTTNAGLLDANGKLRQTWPTRPAS